MDFDTVNIVKVRSGRTYLVSERGFAAGKEQYSDREYLFDYIPERLGECTLIQTAGDDKMIPETEFCFSFEVRRKCSVNIIYSDKTPYLPCWLEEYEQLREKVTRTDSDTSSLKGIFSVFKKKFDPGIIGINGNLSERTREDEGFVASGPLGTNYCMYSVVIKMEE